MPREASFGVIVCRREPTGELSALLVRQDNGAKKESWWGLPKGHAEPGEMPEKSALREVREETGLDDVRLLAPDVFLNTYLVEKHGQQFEKTVTYFVGTSRGGEVRVDGKEVHGHQWIVLDAVPNTLCGESNKTMFTAALPRIKEICDTAL